MADVLSQNEIDELLRSLETGSAEFAPVTEPEVRVYDFKKANRFSKEHVKALSIVFKTFCHHLSNYLMGTLRTACDVDMLSIEEMSFNEFNNSVPTPVVVSILRMPPLSGSLIFEMSSEVSYSIISRVLGGTRGVSDRNRNFTEIELVIIERVVWQILKSVDEAWKKVLPVNASLDRIETSMQFAQIVDLNEPVVVVTNNVKIGTESGLIAFCFPHSSIEPMAEQLNSKLWYTTAAAKIEAETVTISGKLKRTNVVLTAVFQDTQATVSDVLNLQVGDVIRLNHHVKDPLTVKVQHIPKFLAHVGRQGKQSAIKIVDVLKGDEEDE